MSRAPRRDSLARRVGIVLEMIKFQHSIFALPFALAGMLVAADGIPGLWTVCWIVAACVFARSAAMGFNRWADVEFDRQNPRTQGRALVTGLLDRRFALTFTALNSLGFVLSAAMLNGLCLRLSPVALAVLLGYSYVKRVSDLTHFVLGAALGLAPIGAWLAVRGIFEGAGPALVLGLAVMTWTAGFDIIYACQDIGFDRKAGLLSLPASLGVRRALLASTAAHVIAFLGLLGFAYAARLGPATWTASLLVGAVLAAEHGLVRPGDLSRVPVAFFTMNGIVSFAYLAGVTLDVLVLR